MATLSELLGQVRQNESGGNYQSNASGSNIAAPGQPQSHASGAYQFQPATWDQLATQAGYSQYAGQPAGSVPPEVQDAVAGYAAQNYDPNSSFLWQASAPPGGYPTVSEIDASSLTSGTAGSGLDISTVPPDGSGIPGQSSTVVDPTDPFASAGVAPDLPNILGTIGAGVAGGSTGTDALGNPIPASGNAGIFASIASFFERWGVFALGLIMVGIGFYAITKGQDVLHVTREGARKLGLAAAE